MIHIRIDDEELNSKRKFVCGIGPELPDGDTYYDASERADRLADCPGCNPNPRKLGTPLSELSGRPGHPGYAEFRRIARSWGVRLMRTSGWLSDSWRDSYDAWKTREPDDYGYCGICPQCGSEVPSDTPVYVEPLCDDCMDVAELNSLHFDPPNYDYDEFFEELGQ